ncbi:MAG: DUF2461 domain-containing protein [Muribaculaceae bacterium]|nr:DUF2461 domain-containing protein [Muribaculaceae bacterium]
MINKNKQIYEFLDQLAANNNREWFKDHKALFDDLRQNWIDQLDDLRSKMSVWDPDLLRQPLSDCVYRIYRDTRFSHDKTPYKTYFAAVLSPWGRKSFRPCYYLQMGSGFIDSGLYGGMYCPPPQELKKVRTAIVDNIEEFEEIINEPRLKKLFPGWFGEALKTVPKGYDRNHPLAHILRQKDFGKAHLVDEKFFTDDNWTERASEIFSVLKPLNDFFNYSIDEEEQRTDF